MTPDQAMTHAELVALVERLRYLADHNESCPRAASKAMREAADALLSRETGAVAQKPYAYELEYNDQFHQPRKGLAYGPYEPGEHPGEAIFRVTPLYTHPAPAQDEARGDNDPERKAARIAAAADHVLRNFGAIRDGDAPSSEREGG